MISAPGLMTFNPLVQSPKVICCPVERVAIPTEMSTILAEPANLGYDDPVLHDPKSLAVWTMKFPVYEVSFCHPPSELKVVVVPSSLVDPSARAKAEALSAASFLACD